MAIAYFNCGSGVSGGMVVGALLDAGYPQEALRAAVAALRLPNAALLPTRGKRGHVAGWHIAGDVREPIPSPSPQKCRQIAEESDLSDKAKDFSLKIMNFVFETQKKTFALGDSELGFNGKEVMQTLILIAAAADGFAFFDFQSVYASPLPMHRSYPEDVLEGLQNIPLEKSNIAKPLVSLLGLAILKATVRNFGESPLYKIERRGVGLGDINLPEQPNTLSLYIGEGYPTVVLEANIDDMNPEWFDYCMARLFKIGVVDVTLQPIQMKKNRPGVTLKAVTPWDLKEKAIEIILRETTTLGVRYYPLERRILLREMQTVETRFGKVPVKIAKEETFNIEKRIPEYNACRKIAEEQNIPIREVYEEIYRIRRNQD